MLRRRKCFRVVVTAMASPASDGILCVLVESLAGDLYQFMVDQFHQARAFLLEVMVVAILIIELGQVFWRR